MQAFIQLCSTVNKYLSCVILITMVIFVSGNTFLRYFFSSGIIITEEFVRYLFLWGVYLGVISVWYTRGHIRVTTVTDRLTPRGKLYFDVVFEAVSMVVLLVMTYGCYQYFIDTTTVGQVTGIPYSVMILSVLVGSFCCAVISVSHILQDIKMMKLDDATLAKLEQEANKQE
ncbi:MAG TPA: TRAP transporter small permease [Candidatus Avisuccinivibrio pullicola]|nr:TRAP transporter small permease [Candidatus Avisuccinivibrio pullicola]